jgi:hypothetical protein
LGIDSHALDFLVGLRGTAGQPRRLLTLGRQSVNRPVELGRVAGIASELDPQSGAWPEAQGSFEYVERLFRAMNFDAEALDASAYQGADIVHDLTAPLPPDLAGRYNVIYDGGTTEHIFDLPRAFDNLAAMLAEDGVLLSVNMLNGGAGHGLYQFGPELVWSYWKRSRGFDVLVCRAVPVDGTRDHKPFDIEDTGEAGRRPKLGAVLPRGRSYLFYAVRKSAGRVEDGPVYQGDYMKKWADSAETKERRT